MAQPDSKPPSLIMVVDDDWLNRELLEGLLGVYGYGVLLAHSGAQALSLAVARQPNLILLDVRMPDMSGYAVCERLKANPATRPIPVVILTALVIGDEEKQKAAQSGAYGIVNRLLPTEQLMEYLATALTANAPSVGQRQSAS